MLVYCITNNISGKKYVGATERSLMERYSLNWCVRLLSNKELKKDFIENGQKSFSIEIIKRPRTKIALYKWESFFIKKMNCLYPNGYNFQLNRSVHSETRKRISESMKKTFLPHRGVCKKKKTFPCVICEKPITSYACRGVFKKTCSDKCRRARMSQFMTGRTNNPKGVNCGR